MKRAELWSGTFAVMASKRLSLYGVDLLEALKVALSTPPPKKDDPAPPKHKRKPSKAKPRK